MREIAPGVFGYGSPGEQERKLNVAQVLERLTVDEEAAIVRAAADIPTGQPAARLAQAKLRVRLSRLKANAQIDLDDPVLLAFLGDLKTAGLLTQERIDELLA